MTDPSVLHVVEAFDALSRHEPEWERGFLQHTLLVALRTPGGIAMNTALPKALFLVPAQLRGQAYEAADEVHSVVLQLVQIAEKDPRFLKNFMDGNRCASFI